MGDRTKIEWTRDADGNPGATWNPIRARNLKTGKGGWHCVHKSHGCVNCYSERLNLRLGTGLPFKPGHEKDIEIFLDEKMLTQPLRWKRPRMIFVCSMTDLFADFVTDAWLDKIFAVMALCPQHVFQILTKRPERMREYLSDLTAYRIYDMVCDMVIGGEVLSRTLIAPGMDPAMAPPGQKIFLGVWPLMQVWLGVSAEDQATADERVPILLGTPAAVRWVSAEPLLGPIRFINRWLPQFDGCADDDVCPGCGTWEYPCLCNPIGTIDWIVAGGESGRGARPMHPDWARSIRDQCKAAGVAFHFKQFGEHWPAEYIRTGNDGEVWRRFPDNEQWYFDEIGVKDPPPIRFAKVGKKRAGRTLDGVIHDAMPEVRNG